MASTLPNPAVSRPLLSSEIRKPVMAKADLRKAETQAWREAFGQAVGRAVKECGWSLKDFAREVSRDERQCARWIDGSERAQVDVLLAVAPLRRRLIVALAQAVVSDGVEIETVIRIRKEIA